MCTTAQLTITIKGIQGGLSHFGSVLLFDNGGKPCVLHGYPGLDGVNGNGQVVIQAQRTPDGYLGGLALGAAAPNVQLNTGQTASALFEGQNGQTSGGPPCPTYAALLVTPPNETHSVRIPSNYPLCYLQIHPVVSGTIGGALTP